MAEWNVTNNSTGESFTISDGYGDYDFGPLKRPKRSHKRKNLFVGLTIISLVTMLAPIIFSVMAGAKEGKILDNLLLNWPILLLGILMVLFCGIIILGTINKTVKRINKIDFDETIPIDPNHKGKYCPPEKQDENPYFLCEGENISFKNNIPDAVIALLDPEKDKELLQAAKTGKVKYHKYLHRKAKPKDEWLKYREKYIKLMGNKYDGTGEVEEKGFVSKYGAPFAGRFGDKIGVQWVDVNGVPQFNYHPFYEFVEKERAERDKRIPPESRVYTPELDAVIFRDRDCVSLDALVDSYIGIHFKTLFSVLQGLIWAIYPLFALSIILHFFPENNLLLAFKTSLIIFGVFATGFAIYKNFNDFLQYTNLKSAIIHSVIAFCIGGVLGLGIISIISEGYYILNAMTLCMAVLCDIILMVDVAIIKYNKKRESFADNPDKYIPPIHWKPILIVSIVGTAVLSLIVLGISVLYPVTLNEILAFDSGASQDLTNTLTLWGIGFGVSIIVSVGAALLINLNLQKKDIKNFQEKQKQNKISNN